jgi:hypothetical protein
VHRWMVMLLAGMMMSGCDRGPAPHEASSTPEASVAGEPPAATLDGQGVAGAPGGVTGKTPAAGPANASASDRHAAPATPAPPPAPTFREVTLPAGTTLRLVLENGVGSDSSEVEDTVRATLSRAVSAGDSEVLPQGTEVLGVVTDVDRSGRVKGRAHLAFRFTSLRYDGERYDIRTERSRAPPRPPRARTRPRSPSAPVPARRSGRCSAARAAPRRARPSAAQAAPASSSPRAARRCASAQAHRSRPGFQRPWSSACGSPERLELTPRCGADAFVLGWELTPLLWVGTARARSGRARPTMPAPSHPP